MAVWYPGLSLFTGLAAEKQSKERRYDNCDIIGKSEQKGFHRCACRAVPEGSGGSGTYGTAV